MGRPADTRGTSGMRRATTGTWAWALGTATVAALLAIAVNVATDLKDNLLAWIAVVALTLGAGVTAAAMELRRSGAQSASSTAPAVPSGKRPKVGNYGNARDVVQAESIGSVRMGSSSALVMAVGLVVVLASTITIIAQAAARRIDPASSNPAKAATTAGPTATADRAEPFTVSADSLNGSCTAWVTTQTPDKIATALPLKEEFTSYGRWEDLAAVSDGASPSGTKHYDGSYDRDPVEFTVQGNSSQAVTITDLKVRVTKRNPPIKGVTLSRECGGTSYYRWFNVDLDSSPAKISTEDDLKLAPSDEPAKRKVPLELPYTASLSDPETFIVQALTLECDCEWVIDL